MVLLLAWFLVELKFGNVVFWEEGKTGVLREKPLGAKERINNKECVSLGESKNRFVISVHTDSLITKKRKSEKGSFTMTTACPRAPRGKKKQKQNPSSQRRQEEKAT